MRGIAGPMPAIPAGSALGRDAWLAAATNQSTTAARLQRNDSRCARQGPYGAFRRNLGAANAPREAHARVALESPQRNPMTIKSDKWIRRMAQEHGLIEPFE